MQVREIMTTPAQVVDPDCSVKDLAEKMRSDDLGAIPICDGDKILGMATDRDIVTRAVTMDRPLSRCKANRNTDWALEGITPPSGSGQSRKM